MPETTPRFGKPWFLLVLFSVFCVGAQTQPVVQEEPPLLSAVKISRPSFNPSLNQKVAIGYRLGREARVTVRIFGPEGELIKTLVQREERSASVFHEEWDGRDEGGDIVPDEAYSFVIEAVDHRGFEERYDPSIATWSQFDTTSAQISETTNTITYQLPKPCRTRIRIGIEGGPLIHTLVDWKPRTAGEITEHWDGWDRDRALKVRDHPKFKMVITNIELPENTIITYGNRKTDYIRYNQSRGRDSSEFKDPSTTPAPLATLLSPRIKTSFPMTKQYTPGGIPLLSEKTLARVEVEDRDLLAGTPYEIIFFLDGIFYAEEPVGSSPYNWVWDLAGVKPGEHMLTVNVVSFKDQIGTTSRKIIKVVK